MLLLNLFININQDHARLFTMTTVSVCIYTFAVLGVDYEFGDVRWAGDVVTHEYYCCSSPSQLRPLLLLSRLVHFPPVSSNPQGITQHGCHESRTDLPLQNDKSGPWHEGPSLGLSYRTPSVSPLSGSWQLTLCYRHL